MTMHPLRLQKKPGSEAQPELVLPVLNPNPGFARGTPDCSLIPVLRVDDATIWNPCAAPCHCFAPIMK